MTVANRVWKWVAWVLAVLVVSALLAFVVIRVFVGWFIVIPQNGMYPGLPAGSRVFGLKRPYAEVSQVARGDVIMFERDEKGQRYLFIWRVIGLPGETVKVNGDDLLVNGKEVTREKVRSDGELVIYREDCVGTVYEVAFGPKLPPDIPSSVSVTVPKDHLFLLGDNRHHAVDSRTCGPVPFSSVVGKRW